MAKNPAGVQRPTVAWRRYGVELRGVTEMAQTPSGKRWKNFAHGLRRRGPTQSSVRTNCCSSWPDTLVARGGCDYKLLLLIIIIIMLTITTTIVKIITIIIVVANNGFPHSDAPRKLQASVLSLTNLPDHRCDIPKSQAWKCFLLMHIFAHRLMFMASNKMFMCEYVYIYIYIYIYVRTYVCMYVLLKPMSMHASLRASSTDVMTAIKSSGAQPFRTRRNGRAAQGISLRPPGLSSRGGANTQLSGGAV